MLMKFLRVQGQVGQVGFVFISYLHFIDEEPEAQRGKVICPRLLIWAKKLILSDSKLRSAHCAELPPRP